jgi:hypothetical protein
LLLLLLLHRVAMVSAVKWVDEIIEAVPYAINEEFMNKLFTDYGIDYIIHGDDPCLLPDGSDAYAHAKKAGRYKQIKRTEGVSSTDIVGSFLSSFLSCHFCFCFYSFCSIQNFSLEAFEISKAWQVGGGRIYDCLLSSNQIQF